MEAARGHRDAPAGATGSDVTAGGFLFPLSSLSCQASRCARNQLPVPDERENENENE
jgi:hypothetical protein